MIKLYDKVKLNNGKCGFIVWMDKDSDSIMVETTYNDETEILFYKRSDIIEIIKE